MRRKACFNWNCTEPIAKALKNETITGPRLIRRNSLKARMRTSLSRKW